MLNFGSAPLSPLTVLRSSLSGSFGALLLGHELRSPRSRCGISYYCLFMRPTWTASKPMLRFFCSYMGEMYAVVTARVRLRRSAISCVITPLSTSRTLILQSSASLTASRTRGAFESQTTSNSGSRSEYCASTSPRTMTLAPASVTKLTFSWSSPRQFQAECFGARFAERVGFYSRSGRVALFGAFWGCFGLSFRLGRVFQFGFPPCCCCTCARYCYRWGTGWCASRDFFVLKRA